MAKVRVAFLGTGKFMSAHAQRLAPHPEVEICALCDVDAHIANTFIENHLKDYTPRPAVFTAPARMYAEAAPDAVFIATPHTLHFEHGMQALAAGCHIYMEKPMVTSLDHAYRLAAEVENAGKVLVVGYNSTCTPQFGYLRQLIRDKTLGPLEMVSGFLSQDWLRLTTGRWRQDPALSGGGQAYDSGAHLLASLCWSVDAEVDSVFAFVDKHGTAVDINSCLAIRFDNGVLAAIAISGNCPPAGTHMSFMFDGGRVDINGWTGSWIKVWKGREEMPAPPITPDMGFESPDHNFIDAILGRAAPRTGPHCGIIQSQLMDAVYESARTGKPASPKKQQHA